MALDVGRAEKPVQKLRKLLKKMPATPSADDIHEFRTASRRIEATLQALPLDSAKRRRGMVKQIAQLRKRAGQVRDMDVLTKYLSSVPRDSNERKCSVQLLEHLGGQRQKYAKKFDSTKQEYAWELNKRLKRTSRQMEKALARNGRPDPKRTADVAASALKLLTDLKQPARLEKTNLHPYRLKVKELRNLLQMAEHSEQQEFVRRLGEVKDAIGEWHDWEELVTIAKEVLDHGANCQLVHDLRNIGNTKYRNALALSETMRKKYLRISDRKNNRSARYRAHGPSESVWLATSALIA
jgi:CHAD domain-containing protein